MSDQLEKSLVDIAKTLVFTHKKNQTQLFNMIRLALIADCKDTVRVLYNSVHGGFNFSEEFDEYYMKHIGDTNDTCMRTTSIKYLIPFANQILDKNPNIRTHLYLYNKYNLGTVFKFAKDFNDNINEINQIKDCVERCNKVIWYGDEVWVHNQIVYVQYDKHFDYASYTKQSLEIMKTHFQSRIEILNEKQLELKTSIDSIGITWSYFMDNIVNSYNSNNQKDTEFDWKSKRQYSYEAMKFLANIRDIDPFTIDNLIISDENLEEFGLACASGPYCKLSIKELPALEWAINEYDGKERVHIA